MSAPESDPLVQRVMRHSDPRLTTESYGHLALEDLRGALDAAESFGTSRRK
jgi:hypothetical protein